MSAQIICFVQGLCNINTKSPNARLILPSGDTVLQASHRVYDAIKSKEQDEEECEHWEHDHGHCLDCGEDITDRLVAAAEAAYEGDR